MNQHDVLICFAAAAEDAHAELTRLDQLAGDGDFGDNLRDGLRAAVAAADAQPDTPAFQAAAQVFLDEVGGTSGPLLGLLLSEIARGLEGSGQLVDGLGLGVAEGVAAIQRVGGAQPGDRTMVDALVPARDALKDGKPLAEVADAAVQAANATADIRARQGRASYVGDRVIGAPDPGAVAIGMFFEVLARRADVATENG